MPEEHPSPNAEEDAEEDLARDLALTGRELTSGPPCRSCGAPMEPGYLQVRSGGITSPDLRWADPSTPDRGPGEAAESLPWGPFSRWHALRGFHCPECKRLEVGYGPVPAAPPAPPEGGAPAPR